MTDMLQHQQRLAEDHIFDPDGFELIDTSDAEVSTKLSYKSMVQLTSTSPWGAKARRAIIVRKAVAFGLAHIFSAVMSGAHGEIEIFRNRDSALAWLADMGLPQPEPSGTASQELSDTPVCHH